MNKGPLPPWFFSVFGKDTIYIIKSRITIMVLAHFQVIKDNKIWIWAKHEEKTPERLTKSKFSKEYELGEKIETHTLTGVLTPDGRLTVGAFAKGHGTADGMTTSKSDDDKQSTGGGRKSVDGLKQTQSCVGLVQST